MNIVAFTGVMLSKPTLSKHKDYFSAFQLGSIEENQSQAVIFNCIARGRVCNELYALGETGKVFFCRGRLLYNNEKHSNYVEVIEFMNLTPKDNLVTLNINEFLDIYKPDLIMERLQATATERKKINYLKKSNLEDIPPDDIMEGDTPDEPQS